MAKAGFELKSEWLTKAYLLPSHYTVYSSLSTIIYYTSITLLCYVFETIIVIIIVKNETSKK